MAEAGLPGPPAWVRAAAAVVPRLPAGRYRLLGRLPGAPLFEARLPRAAGGYRYACDLRDDIAREVCFTGGYAPQETALVRAALPPGGSFVDVGANWGYFTLVGAAAMGAGGRIVAVEPEPRMFALLERNLARNGLAGAWAFRVAAAEGAGRAGLRVFPEGQGNRGLSALSAEGGGEPVETAALDDLVDAAGMRAVDLVKIDVEGAELRVLRGMAPGLARGRYRRILLELHPAATPGVAAGVADLLRAAGFRGWWVDHSPSTSRRFAYGGGVVGDLLAPVGEGGREDAWPHQLWLAPGVALP